MSGRAVGQLYAAAKLMREQHGPEHIRHAFWHALADLLAAEARRADGGPGGIDEVRAPTLAVARAYLGGEAA